MAEEKIKPRVLSMSNTKKEMIDTYNALLKQLQEKSEAELKPEKQIEEKKKREVGGCGSGRGIICRGGR
jgi:hypothetical protein